MEQNNPDKRYDGRGIAGTILFHALLIILCFCTNLTAEQKKILQSFAASLGSGNCGRTNGFFKKIFNKKRRINGKNNLPK